MDQLRPTAPEFVQELWYRISRLASQISGWTIFALVFALVNLKVLPFGWHTRLIYTHLRYNQFDHRKVNPGQPESPTLFQSTIFTTYSPLGELDFNIHKSNSTYLTDLDIARGHHLYAICRNGIRKYSQKGTFGPALGGVTCSFKRQIRPYRKFEIWTRVLSWDDKWLYLVSHFVQAGSIIPKEYTDQPWRGTQLANTPLPGGGSRRLPEHSASHTHPAIYATCISKYVFKQGRKSIPPIDVLDASGLLISKPKAMSACISTAPNSNAHPSSANQTDHKTKDNTSLERELATWNAIEERRKKGVALAEHMAALEEAHALFTGQDYSVFAKY